jgi:hypothetical protein
MKKEESKIYILTKIKLSPYYILYTKIDSKGIRSVNTKATTTKVLEEKNGINLHDFSLVHVFLRRVSKGRNIRGKVGAD